jgi:regulator of protease activity HflC (stomatin/prohibitin superfamily)
MRFGHPARLHGSGLLLAWPRPIETVVVIPAPARQMQLQIRRFENSQNGNFTSTQGFFLSSDPRENGGFLSTGDSGVVRLQAKLFYQVSDPVAYMVAQDHVEPALERLFIASTVGIVAGRDLDSILVARPEVASEAHEALRRESLRTDLLRSVNSRLAQLGNRGMGLGITVSRVDLVPSIPGSAKEAFDNVLIVTQTAEAEAASARTSAQLTAQQANRQKDRTAASATAAAEELTASAHARTASIAAIAQQSHDMSRNMQLTRIYYDRIGPVLKKARRVDVVDSSGAVRTILPGGSP